MNETFNNAKNAEQPSSAERIAKALDNFQAKIQEAMSKASRREIVAYLVGLGGGAIISRNPDLVDHAFLVGTDSALRLGTNFLDETREFRDRLQALPKDYFKLPEPELGEGEEEELHHSVERNLRAAW